jgi:hypothetical protein
MTAGGRRTALTIAGLATAALATAAPLAACGGTTPPPAPTSSASDSPAPRGNADITLTGAVSGNLAVDLDIPCGKTTDANDTEFDLTVYGTLNGEHYNLGIVVQNATKAGSYPIADNSAQAQFGTTDDSAVWDAYRGTVTLAEDRQSGRLDLDLSAGGHPPDQPLRPTHVTGTFACGDSVTG